MDLAADEEWILISQMVENLLCGPTGNKMKHFPLI